MNTQGHCGTTNIGGDQRFGPPFSSGIEAGAAQAVPGAVGVSGEAAVGARRAVGMATVQGNLGDPEL